MTNPAAFAVAVYPDGATLLDRVAAVLASYVAFPGDAARDAVALWAVHTHAVGCFDSSPRLALLSPEPQSGKTRTMEVLDLLTREPMFTSNATVAVLARSIDERRATVLLDEADAVFGSRAQEHEDLRAILNAGHRRGATYDRMVGVGAGMVAKRFDVFTAVAVAGIGDLPETILQRAVVVRMRRRAPDEQVQPFRYRHARLRCEPLRDALAGWAEDHADLLANAEPVMPEGITDRPADVWEPLLAVADAAGGIWPRRARAACVQLVAAARSTDSGSLGVRLLADLRTVFGAGREVLFAEDRLSTDAILDALHGMEEAPWADLKGKPLDARGLARRLRGYGVRSTKVKIDGRPLQGYRAEDLHDAWSRYLPALASGQETEPVEPAEPRRSEPPAPVPHAARVPFANGTSPRSGTAVTAADLRRSIGSGGSVPPESRRALCTDCQQPLDPALVAVGGRTHPTCEEVGA